MRSLIADSLLLILASHQMASMFLAQGATPAASAVPARGTVVVAEDFGPPGGLGAWQGTGRVVEMEGRGGVLEVVVSSPDGGSSAGRVLELSAEAWQGCTLNATVRVRGDEISVPPQPWNGVKFMLEVEGPAGRTWPAATLGVGTFDWQRAAFSARIPSDATRLRLHIGLEAVTGRVWFDDVRLVVRQPPRREHPAQGEGMSAVVRALPRSRGAMVGRDVDAKGLRVLGRDWGANLVRWQLIRFAKAGESTPLAAFDGWLEAECARLDQALRACERYGLRVVVDLHSPPGGRGTVSGYIGSDGGLFAEPSAQTAFVSCWERLAKRYRGRNVIWGFDLANEPVEGFVEEDCDDWHDLAERAARAVYAVDAGRVVVVEPNDWGSVEALRDFEPVDAPNVVYSVHMYVPMQFTHQGVFDRSSTSVRYPGEIDGRSWNRAALAAVLQTAVEFQRRHHVRLYVGEFSAIRWAPEGSAERYLADLVSLFEERGWDWSYHAFREWQGWSVEHGERREDTEPATTLTGRQRVLREGYALNGGGIPAK